MAEVLLEHVTKIYPGDVKAVDNIDLAIADREFVVLVGPSGCGKSTTLRMIAGLEDVTAGTIRIGGRVVNDVAPKDRDIAMVFQNYALYPHMTVYRNMAFGLMLRREYAGWDNPLGWLLSRRRYRRARTERREIDERVHRAAAVLGIEALLHRRPKALSGGQRQRVAVGRAIVRAPQAYLFDEPLSNLDAKLRVEMRAELKSLHRQVQTTTVYVTHDQEEAMTLGDRVVVMKDGVIQQVGTPFEVYRQPVNRFVAGFLGTPPMNFLEARVTPDGAALLLEGGIGAWPLDPAQRARLAGRAGAAVVLGIRPEGVRLGAAAPAGCTLPLTIEVVEPLGERMDVHARVGPHKFICRLEAGEALREGQTVPVRVDPARVHLFAPGPAGRNLAADAAGP